MTELQAWQPAIGSFLGFVALFFAALLGFRLNRRRDEQLRMDEVRSIAVALYAEVTTLRNYAATMANRVAYRFDQHERGRREISFDEHFFEMVPMPDAPVLAALSPKIGKLPVDILQGIMRFHACYSEAKYWLPRLEEKEERGFSYGVLWVLHPALKAVEEVQETLEKIEELARVPSRAVIPDVKQAKEVTAWEEEQWEAIREHSAEE